LFAALAVILLGIAFEFGQKLISGRSCETRDMFINSFGVLTGILIGLFASRIRHISPRVPAD